MTIYKVVNDKDKAIIAYYTQYIKAMQCIKDLSPWYTTSFHIELEVALQTNSSN